MNKQLFLLPFLLILCLSIFSQGTSGDLNFTDSLFVEVQYYHTSDTSAFINLEDADQNSNSTSIDIVSVLISSEKETNAELLTLFESDINSGIFQGFINIEQGIVSNGDGVIQVNSADRLTVSYDDPLNDQGLPETITDYAVYGYTIIGGELSQDSTLPVSKSPYLVDDTVTILSGHTLTIDPGVELYFRNKEGIGINVFGSLVSNGSLNDSIHYRALDTNSDAGDWEGIKLMNSSAFGSFSYNHVEHATNCISVYSTNSTSSSDTLRITNSWLTNSFSGIYFEGFHSGTYAAFIFDSITINNILNYGISTDLAYWSGDNVNLNITNSSISDADIAAILLFIPFNATVNISNNVIESDSNGICIDEGVSGIISSNHIEQMTSKKGIGISLPTTYPVTVNNNTVMNFGIGISVPYDFGVVYTLDSNNLVNNTTSGIVLSSTQQVRGNSFSNNVVGLELKGGQNQVEHNSFLGNGTGILVDEIYNFGYINNGNSIVSNLIQGNGVGLENRSDSSIIFQSNSMIQNTLYHVKNTSPFYVNAKYNYWDDTTRTEISMGGNPKNLYKVYDWFDTISSGFVDYSNWRTCDTCLPQRTGNHYGGTADETAYSIDITTDSGFVIAGETVSADVDVWNPYGNKDLWVARLNADGDTLWTRAYGGTSHESAYSIEQTADGGFIVCGTSTSDDGVVPYTHGGYDFWVLKLDSDGDTTWTGTYGGSGDEFAHKIIPTTDGGFMVAGYTNSTDGEVSGNHGSDDIWLVKLNSTGDTSWTKAYGGSGNETLSSIKETNDGGYIFIGSTTSLGGDVSTNNGELDYWVVKLTSSGIITWDKSLGGTDFDYGGDIIQTQDNNFLIAGHSNSTDGYISGHQGGFDFWIAKLNQTGDTLWTKIYGGTGNEMNGRIVELENKAFAISGYTDSDDGDISGNHGGEDFWFASVDSLRNIQHQQCMGGSANEQAYGLAISSDKKCLVMSGSATSNDGNVFGNWGDKDMWMVECRSRILEVTPSSLLISSFADSASFSVYSNMEWTVFEQLDWLSIHPSEGTDTATFIVNYDENTSPAQRTGKIYVFGEGGVSDTLTLTQEFHLIYDNSFGGTGDDIAYSLVSIADSGCVVAGETTSNDLFVHSNKGGKDLWVVRIDNAGDTVWTRTFGGGQDESATSMLSTSDGNILIAGWSSSSDGDVLKNNGGFDAWLIKIDVDGDTLWTRNFGGSGNDFARQIKSTLDGGFVLAGYSSSADGDVPGNKGGNDFWITKLDNNGFISWSKNFGGSANEYALSIVQLPDSGFVAAGSANSVNGDVSGQHGNYDYWIVRLNKAGDTLWTKTMGGSASDMAYEICVTTDSMLLVSGHSFSTDGDVTANEGGADFWLTKLDDAGNEIWNRNYGGSSDEKEARAIIGVDGDYILSGYSNSNDGDSDSNKGMEDYWMLKASQEGDLIWQKEFGGSESDKAYASIQKPDGNIILSGYTESDNMDVFGNYGGKDIWMASLMDTLLFTSPSNLALSNSNDSANIHLNSNTSWSATASESWITLSPVVGAGNDSVQVNVSDNSSGAQRTGQVIISGNGVSNDTVSVVQAPGNNQHHFIPVWSGNPYLPMTILVQGAILDGDDLLPGDEIAVFDKDSVGNLLCVGAAELTDTLKNGFTLAISLSADDPTTTEVDGFKSGNELLFVVWDSTELKECENVYPDYDPAFDSAFTQLGTALVQLTAINDVTQAIELMSGWNIHSFAVIPDSMNMKNVHEVLIDSGYLIKIINEAGGFMQYIPGFGWLNTIGDASHTEGYYIKVNDDVTLEITGLPIQTPFTIPLNLGWNIQGYPLLESQLAMNAFQPLIDSNELIKVISESGAFIQFIPGFGWLNTIGNLETDEGYYIKVSANTSITLDYPTAKSSYILPQQLVSVRFDEVFKNNPYFPMNIVVKRIDLDGLPVSEGDEIGVYDGDICVGTGVVFTEGEDYLAYITVSADDPTTLEIDGFIEGHKMSFRYYSGWLNSVVQAEPMNVMGAGSFEQLGTYVCELSGSLLSDKEFESEEITLTVVPNPVQSSAKAFIQLDEKGEVFIQIVNLNGALQLSSRVKADYPGVHQIDLKAEELKPGVYFIRIYSETNGKYKQVIERFVKL